MGSPGSSRCAVRPPQPFAAVVQVIAAADAVGVDVRLAAAVNFKNTVKYRWVSASRELPSTSSSNRPGEGWPLSFLSPAPLPQAPTEQALDAGTQAITDPEKVGAPRDYAAGSTNFPSSLSPLGTLSAGDMPQHTPPVTPTC